jgi:hypothetical protein
MYSVLGPYSKKPEVDDSATIVSLECSSSQREETHVIKDST